jgi:hypothetical protein
MATESGLLSAISSIHKGDYPEKITREPETAQLSLWCVYVYSNAQGCDTQHVPQSEDAEQTKSAHFLKIN